MPITALEFPVGAFNHLARFKGVPFIVRRHADAACLSAGYVGTPFEPALSLSEGYFYPWGHFFPPVSEERAPRVSHIDHSEQTIFTKLGRLGWPGRRRSSIARSPMRLARRIVFWASFLQTPARAAIAAKARAQEPLSRHSSPTIRSTASSPTVNLQAREGGIGPDDANLRRRSIDAARRGGRCGLRGGKMLLGR